MAGNKYIKNSAGTLAEEVASQTSTGVGDAGKIVALDSTGKLDTSLLPTGIGADTAAVEASEALSAGDLVNIYDSLGAKCRKADASTSGKEAHGFVLENVNSAATATIYFEGNNPQVTGLTPGVQFLSAVTPGAASVTAPTGSGNTVQKVGFATSATNINFQSGVPITLA